MVQLGHRLSHDIDIFIDDPQYLPMLSPRLNQRAAETGADYDEAAHYVKLRLADGEIDFIYAPSVTGLPPLPYDHGGRLVPLEPPAEIACKKLRYRGANLTGRDIFDLAVVLDRVPDLGTYWPLLAPQADAIRRRIDTVPKAFLDTILAELAVLPGWEPLRDEALERVRAFVAAQETT